MSKNMLNHGDIGLLNGIYTPLPSHCLISVFIDRRYVHNAHWNEPTGDTRGARSEVQIDEAANKTANHRLERVHPPGFILFI